MYITGQTTCALPQKIQKPNCVCPIGGAFVLAILKNSGIIPPMKFYIVTPAYNALQWLQGCVRSIADQVCDSVEVHHHVQDGGSTDGSQVWLEVWQREHADTPGYELTFESGKDAGLYDAINIGWRKLPDDADIVAHLNADEQYLPGVLAEVAEKAAANPGVDLFTTAHIILDKDLRYICHRRPAFPNKYFSRLLTQLITNTCFHRAESFRKRNIYFDCSYRSLGDLIFFRDIMETKPRVLRIPNLFGSTFVVTGVNVSWSEISKAERLRIQKTLSRLAVKMIPFCIKISNGLCRLSDIFNKPPREYAVYNGAHAERTSTPIHCPRASWRMRSIGE